MVNAYKDGPCSFCEPGEQRSACSVCAGTGLNVPSLQFFATGHLKPGFKEMVEKFRDVAAFVVQNSPNNPERTAALRKIVEAKDAACRALIMKTHERLVP